MKSSLGKLQQSVLIGIIWTSFLILAESSDECEIGTKILDRNKKLTHMLRVDYDFCVRCLDKDTRNNGNLWYKKIAGARDDDWYLISNGSEVAKPGREEGVRVEDNLKWFCFTIGQGLGNTLLGEDASVACNCSGTEKEKLDKWKLPILRFPTKKVGCSGPKLMNGVCLEKPLRFSNLEETCKATAKSSLEGYHICGDDGTETENECLLHVKRFNGETVSKHPLVATDKTNCDNFKEHGTPALSSIITVLPGSEGAMVPCFDDKPPKECLVDGVPKSSDVSKACTGKLAIVSGSFPGHHEISCEYENGHKWWGFVANATMTAKCHKHDGKTECTFPAWTSKSNSVVKKAEFGLTCKESLTVYSPAEQNIAFESPPMKELCTGVTPAPPIRLIRTRDVSDIEKAFQDYTWAFILGGIVLGLLLIAGAFFIFYYVGRSNAKKGQTDGFSGWTYKKAVRLQRKAQTKMGQDLPDEPTYLKTVYNAPVEDEGEEENPGAPGAVSKETYEEEFAALKAEKERIDADWHPDARSTPEPTPPDAPNPDKSKIVEKERARSNPKEKIRLSIHVFISNDFIFFSVNMELKSEKPYSCSL